MQEVVLGVLRARRNGDPMPFLSQVLSTMCSGKEEEEVKKRLCARPKSKLIYFLTHVAILSFILKLPYFD